MKRAVVLLSGGLDSTTTLAMARAQAFECYALSFDYGQRHKLELEAAHRAAALLGAHEHRVVRIDHQIFSGSALTNDIAVPKSRTDAEIGHGVPITYVPARNIVFLAFGLAWAEARDAFDIFIGINALDYSGYPDCRPGFINAFEKMANLGTKAGDEGSPFRIHTPLAQMSKAQIIRKALELGVDLSITHSCYDPGLHGEACGLCDSCQLRRKGFREVGVNDPIAYAA
jgi:7-cyano-7-deazaguanine synthase